MPKRAGQLSLHRSMHERAVVIACRMLHAGPTMGVAAVWDVMAMAKHEHGHCVITSGLVCLLPPAADMPPDGLWTAMGHNLPPALQKRSLEVGPWLLSLARRSLAEGLGSVGQSPEAAV
jgi:hypothetical protein